MTKVWAILTAAVAAALCMVNAASACGDGARCEVTDGYYLAAAPADWDGATPLPLIVYFHGWNSSPEATFRNKAMLRAAHQRGALFVAPFAPNGYWRQIGDGRAERGRDEAAFIRGVMADIGSRWPIDPARTLSSGFSRGGSMSWNVACYLNDLFTGHAPIAGGFWDSTPGDCPSGPVTLRHIHGTSDKVVAYNEIGIYNSMPIPEGFAVLLQTNGCATKPDLSEQIGRLRCERWSKCASGAPLELCLHDGGHSIPAEWVAEGLDWLDAVRGDGD